VRDLFEEEAPKSERLFSQVTTAWYDWAVAEMLGERRVHCWALTADYYSMVHAARTPMIITSCYEERFVTHHSEFPRFLAGERKYAVPYNKSIEELSKALNVQPDYVGKLFAELHDVLSTFKEARNETSYEKYIISHQCRQDIEASEWLSKICDKASACVVSTNQKISELIYKYVRLHELHAYYVHHLREEIAQFKELLQKEQLTVPKKLEPIINKFNTLVAHTPEPARMNSFMEQTRTYPSKDKSYEKLLSILYETQKL
jgi:hypothetical protein